MKDLNRYIKESILDDEEDLIDNPGIQVSEWLNRHKTIYGIENGRVNNDGTIDANTCSHK